MFLPRSGNRLKTRTKLMKQRFKNHVFLDIDFWRILEPTWADFGCQVEAQERQPPRHFSPGVRYIIILLFWSPILVATWGASGRPGLWMACARVPESVPRASKIVQNRASRPKSLKINQKCWKLLKIVRNRRTFLQIENKTLYTKFKAIRIIVAQVRLSGGSCDASEGQVRVRAPRM